MPDSFGKRHRDEVKAKKAAARDARRVARTKRRAAGGASGSTPEAESMFAAEGGTPDGAQPRFGSSDAGGQE